MAATMTVLPILAALVCATFALDVSRQAGQIPALVESQYFREQYYTLTGQMIAEQIKVYRCFAGLWFQDASPPLPMMSADPTQPPATAAPTHPPTPSAQAREADSFSKRQGGPFPPPGPQNQNQLYPWQRDVLRDLYRTYQQAVNDYNYCQQIISRQGPQ